MKRIANDLAVLGAEPLFSRPLSTGQLANRDPERFFELAGGALNRRWLTNQGPLVAELEERLSQFHESAHCIAFANAFFALMLSCRNLARSGASEVLLPSLTFRGLPDCIRWAGLTPRYCDVDASTHTLDPACLAEQIDRNTALVLAVDNVIGLSDVDALEQVTEQAGVPLLMDSVYAVGGQYRSGPVGSRGRATVFSLHATKLLNGFEGGYAVTSDGQLATALRSQRNFGYPNDDGKFQLGLNAKLNEIHAAFALSNLPHLASIICDNRARYAAYRESFREIPWVSFPDYDRSPGNFGLVLLKVEPFAPYARDELVRILRAENALVRPYYSPPLHQMDKSLKNIQGTTLPVSERLSREYVQMPVGDPVSIDDIHRLGEFFKLLDLHADSIRYRLRSSRDD